MPKWNEFGFVKDRLQKLIFNKENILKAGIIR